MADNLNVGKDINNKEEKAKTFYSVNLTEGRIFVIFVSLVLLFVIIFFGVFLLISKINRSNYSRLDNNDNNSHSELNFYDSSIKKDETTDIDKKNNETTKVIISNNSNTEEIKEPEIKIDNSEPLYSSKFKEEKTKPVINTNNTKTNKEKAVTKTTTTTIKGSKAKKYVIQIGSYLNKETALEIENFYKKSGYPTYIQNYSKDGKIYYRLRVGPFLDKKTAENYLVNLKQSKYGKNSYISIINI